MPEQLLAGPRGRRLCLEFARRQGGAATVAVEEFNDVLFWAAYGLEKRRGTAGALFGPGAGDPPPTPSPGDVARALDGIPLAAIEEAALVRALADSVAHARYWQEPDGTDLLLRDAELVPSLERVAARLAASEFTRWWGDSMASAQWDVELRDEGESPQRALGADQALRRWREGHVAEERRAARERPEPVTANVSGEWWSTPPWSLAMTTREVPGFGPLALWTFEDGIGREAAVVRPVVRPEAARVYEIVDRASWIALCRGYPLEASASRRHDWYRATERDGRWVIPDWSRVAEDFDAVHLTVAAYLMLAGTVIGIDVDTASVIAGWGPDRTHWLANPPATASLTQRWGYDRDAELWEAAEA